MRFESFIGATPFAGKSASRTFGVKFDDKGLDLKTNGLAIALQIEVLPDTVPFARAVTVISKRKEICAGNDGRSGNFNHPGGC